MPRGTLKLDEDFQAMEDARILMMADDIKSDKKRMEAASKAAQKIVEEETQKLNGMKKIARKFRRG
jgi:hypothetical protein